MLPFFFRARPVEKVFGIRGVAEEILVRSRVMLVVLERSIGTVVEKVWSSRGHCHRNCENGTVLCTLGRV